MSTAPIIKFRRSLPKSKLIISEKFKVQNSAAKKSPAKVRLPKKGMKVVFYKMITSEKCSPLINKTFNRVLFFYSLYRYKFIYYDKLYLISFPAYAPMYQFMLF